VKTSVVFHSSKIAFGNHPFGRRRRERREIDDGLEFFQDTKQTGSLLVKVIKFIKKNVFKIFFDFSTQQCFQPRRKIILFNN